MQQVTMKYAKQMQLLEGGVDWNLHFHLLKEFHWNYDVNQGDLAIQYQKPPMQIQSAMYMFVYIYILSLQ